jgi:hypothetical protein
VSFGVSLTLLLAHHFIKRECLGPSNLFNTPHFYQNDCIKPRDRCIDFVCFCDFLVDLWNCSDMFFFGISCFSFYCLERCVLISHLIYVRNNIHWYWSSTHVASHLSCVMILRLPLWQVGRETRINSYSTWWEEINLK